MKWFKKKGFWFSVGLEVIMGVLCFAAAIAAIAGLVAYAVATVAIVVVAAIFAAGGDISV
jgi:hypothetical protein